VYLCKILQINEYFASGVCIMQIAYIELPSQAKPSQAKPSQAKPSQAKPSQAKLLISALLLASSFSANAQTITTTKRAVNPSTGAAITMVKPGDTVKYIIDYKFVPGGAVSGVQNVTLTDNMEGQTFVPGSLQSNGWNPSNPSVFINGVAGFKLGTFTSTGTLGVLSAENKLEPPALAIDTGSGGGDGYTPILYGGKVYEIFHHTGATGSGPIIFNYNQVNCQSFPGGVTCPGYPKNTGTTSDDGVLANPLIGSKVYFAAQSTLNSGIGCWDMALEAMCPFVRLAPSALGFWSPKLGGVVQSGTKMYMSVKSSTPASNFFDVFCYDTTLPASAGPGYGSNCAGFNGVQKVPSATGTQPLMHIKGNNLYVVATDGNGSNALACLDVNTGNACAGAWPKPAGGFFSNMFPHLSSAGVEDGICVINTPGVQTAVCYDAVGTGLSGVTLTAAGYHQNGIQVPGTAKMLFGTANAPNTECFDFSTNTGCVSFGTAGIKTWDAGRDSTYGYNFYAFNPAGVAQCAVALGHEGKLWTFNTFTGDSPCLITEQKIPVKADFINYCDGNTTRSNAWASVTLNNAAAQMTVATINVRDPATNALLQTFSYTGTGAIQTKTFNLSPVISYTTYPTLNVEVIGSYNAQTPATYNAYVTADLVASDGANPQICYQATIDQGVCTPGKALSNTVNFTSIAVPALGASSTAPTCTVPLIAVGKVADKATVKAGDVVTWTINAANTGNLANVGIVTLSDAIPSNVSGFVVTSTPPVACTGTPVAGSTFGGCTIAADALKGSLGTPSSPNVGSFTIAATVLPGAAGSTISNTVTPSSSSPTDNAAGMCPNAAACKADTIVGSTISGHVFNDVNGLNDGTVNGPGTNAGGLVAVLLDSVGNVVANAIVQADGSYSFAGVPNGNYSIALNNVPGTVGSALISTTLPPGWVNTGETTGIASGSDGTVNGRTPVTVIGNVTEVNFGIEQPPVAGNNVQPSQGNPGGTNTIPIPASAFTNSTDGASDSSGGLISGIFLPVFPANATSITINGVTYTAVTFPSGGVTITVAQLAGLVVDPVDGATVVDLPYKAIDDAGKLSVNTGSVKLPLSTIVVAGTVFNDANGLSDTIVNGLPTTAGVGTLTVYLIDSTGTVVGMSPVASNGTYLFTGVSNGNYSVVLSNVPGIAALSANPGPSLPPGWVNVGENLGTSSGSDSTANGILPGIVVSGANVINANFGIDQPPTAKPVDQPSQANPGGTVSVPVPPTAFGALDPEDGAVGIVITVFPGNAASITVNGVLYTPSTFPAGGIKVLVTQMDGIKIDPIDGAPTVEIIYRAIDAAGQLSAPAATHLPFIAQQIGVVKRLTKIEQVTTNRYKATFEVTVLNTGTVPNTYVQVSDNVAVTFPSPSALQVVDGLVNTAQVGGATALQCAVNPSTPLPLTSVNLMTGLTVLAPGAGCTYQFAVTFDKNGAKGPFQNQAKANSYAAPAPGPGQDNLSALVVSDLSDDGTDPRGTNPGQPGDTGGSNDSTPITLPAALSGSVWNDTGAGANGSNRLRDPSEAGPSAGSGQPGGLKGWRIEVVYPPGSPKAGQVVTTTTGLAATATTAADGTYQVLGLPAGNFQVRFMSPANTPVQWGTPVNGENGTAQPGSVVNSAAGVLDVVIEYGTNLPEQSLPVDPSGVIYDAITRAPVGGATVQLGIQTGSTFVPLPASCLLPGQQSQVTAATGDTTGYYRFDVRLGADPACPVGATEYTIKVTAAGYVVPSQIIPSSGAIALPVGLGVLPVQLNAGPPPLGSTPTTYYSSFTFGAGTKGLVHNHIPIDPNVKPQLFIEKKADRRVVEIGDSMSYSIRVRNPNAYAVPAVTVLDKLPLGFKLITGTSSLSVGSIALAAAVMPDPVGTPGPVLNYSLGALAANTEYTIRYRVRVGVGADKGTGINTAQASGAGGAVQSMVAQAVVKVAGGVFATQACLIGKVYVDCNQNKVQDRGEPGIPGVRLYLEDGTNFTTDENGQYSFCGLRPISHAIKVDATTMPVGARLGVTSSRNLGDADMLVIDAKNGELHRADFREMSCFPKVLEQVQQRRKLGPVYVPEKQMGKDDPWGIEFNSEQHRLNRTPSLGNQAGGRK
jgi:uncharacterized repeat protein (TIGR01451 family)